MLNNRYEPWKVLNRPEPLTYEDDVSDEPMNENSEVDDGETFDGMEDYDPTMPFGRDNDEYDTWEHPDDADLMEEF